jgi:formylglycine-generating enzyme required for sulfatase activity
MYYVSWKEAVEYCNRRSEKEGLRLAYSISRDTVVCDWNANGYRLPTEAEWEYAAKGGKKGSAYLYAGGDNLGEVAWYYDNSDDKTHEAGKKKANDLGIYDLSGNVWEWRWDWYGAYSQSAQTDPRGPVSGTYRVRRGGSWGDYARFQRSSFRLLDSPDRRSNHIGFRVARSP